MDYKKIVKSPKTRNAILHFLRFVPDKTMIKWQYYIKMGRRLNLKNPERYSEKLQWYKLYYRNSLMSVCADKYNVRKYVTDCGLSEILNQCFGVYECPEDIDFNVLPERFVIKKTTGGGGRDIIFCRNKKDFDIDAAKKQIATWFTGKFGGGGREWAYNALKPRIIIEEYLENVENPQAGINDYKFLCYQGKAKYVHVDTDRYICHKRNYYDIEWNNLHMDVGFPPIDKEIKKPENFERMIQVAEQLSKEFPYCRVDLYNLSGKIVFGELTFYPWSGYVKFNPDEWDFKLGEDFELIEYQSK